MINGDINQYKQAQAIITTWTYRQNSNISRSLVGNKIVDHSDVVGASPVGAAPTTSSFSTSGFNKLGQDIGKTRRKSSSMFLDLVWLISEI